MKNLFLILALIFSQALTYGQSIFDQLEEMDDVTSVILNKEAFKILSKFDQKSFKGNEAMEIFQMVQDLDELKVFNTKSASVAKKDGKYGEIRSKKTKTSRINEDERWKFSGFDLCKIKEKC